MLRYGLNGAFMIELEGMMSHETFRFEYDTNGGTRKVVFETTSMRVPDILEDFRDFLQGCGFNLEGQDVVAVERDIEGSVEDIIHMAYEAGVIGKEEAGKALGIAPHDRIGFKGVF